MKVNNTIDAFFALVRGGLWEQDVQLKQYGDIAFEDIMSLAEDQAVVGLVTAGLEHVRDIKILQSILLQFIGLTIQLEQRNTTMNSFIAEMVMKMRAVGIYTLLVKGQGIAQCYERPLWRSCGDIDFFLSKDNFQKAKSYLLPLSSGNKPERGYSKELGMNIDPWYVEIHGTLRTGLATRVDKMIDDVQRSVFYEGKVRSWMNGETQVLLPGPNEDVFFVFTHFIKHFYKDGGVSMRQLCDWCRLLWSYRNKVDISLLEKRLRRAGLMNEWKTFATIGVGCLGMPCEAMPLYSMDNKWSKKADKTIAFILKGGKWRKQRDTLLVGQIFPINTLRFAPGILFNVSWLKVKERLLKS